MSNGAKTYSEQNPRIFIFYWIFGCLILILFAALAYRQIFLHKKYASAGELQTLRRIVKPGARGEIFDRHGRIIVANKPVFSAVVYNENIKKEMYKEYLRIAKIHPEKTRNEALLMAWEHLYSTYQDKVNSYLGTDYSIDFKKYIKRHGVASMMPVPLVEDLTAREHAILSERVGVNSPIEIMTDSARTYPYTSAAAQLLGWVKIDQEDLSEGMPGEGLYTLAYMGKRGRSGIEAAFDNTLSGSFGTKIWVVDINSNRYDNIYDEHPKKGKDLHTSIDIDLQLAAEAALGGRKGALVAVDVRTGEVLAMASHPTYDLNLSSPRFPDYDEVSETGAFLNRASQGLYPPGSTFKIVTAIAGLEHGAITLDSMSNCTGSIMIGSRKAVCNSRYGHGWVNLSDAIAKSCNVFFYEHALKMGVTPISDMAATFGLGAHTGIEIGSMDRKSVIANPKYKAEHRPEQGGWSSGDTANMSIGQGFMLQTPIQMAAFTASLARGETRTRLSILHDPNRIADMYYHGAQKLKITDEEFSAVIRGMEEAVLSGTCRRAAIDGVRVAAKSGTAQIFPNNRPLDLAWMIAFAPVDNPQIAIAVVIEGESVNDVAGGKTAGPAVQKVLSKFFEYAPSNP